MPLAHQTMHNPKAARAPVLRSWAPVPIPPHHFDPWPRLPGFHVISVATSMEAPGSTYGPWKLDRWGLFWVMSGGGTSYLDDEALPTAPGTVTFVEPGRTLRHDWGEARSSQAFVVFGWEGAANPWPAVSWPRQRALPEHHFLFVLWRYLLAFQLDDAASHPVVVPMLELMLRIYASDSQGEVAPVLPALPEQVDRAIRAISAHLAERPAEPLRLEALARCVHVTPQHLCRLFKECVGLGPIECAQALRLELASGLLERSELSLAQIADRFGFSTQFHFSRAFKQAYGMAPSEYRKAFRAGIATRPTGLMFRHHVLRRYFYEAEPGKILKP
jgi:AraC-like DNA-binding protein